MKLAVTCAFCEHANPGDARFCNACGSPVHLHECSQCEAINDGEAALCYKCGTALAGRTQSTREARGAAKPQPANDAAMDGDFDIATRQGASGITSTIVAAYLPESAPAPSAKLIAAAEPGTTAAPSTTLDALPTLRECPVCEALNTLSAAACAACGAALETNVVPGFAKGNSSASADAPATPPDDALPLWHPVIVPDDIPLVEDLPVHFIGDADPSIPTDASQQRIKGGWIAAAAVALIVLPTIATVGAFAYMRPAALEHAIAVVRSAVALPMMRGSVENSQPATPVPVALPATSAAEPVIVPAINAPEPVDMPAISSPVTVPSAAAAVPATSSAAEASPVPAANGVAPTSTTEESGSSTLGETASAIPETANAARPIGASEGKAGASNINAARRASPPATLAGSKASLASGTASRARSSVRRASSRSPDNRTANRANASRAQVLRPAVRP